MKKQNNTKKIIYCEGDINLAERIEIWDGVEKSKVITVPTMDSEMASLVKAVIVLQKEIKKMMEKPSKRIMFI